MRLATNPALEISELDSDASEPMVICQVPAKDGMLRLALPSALADLLEQFDGRRTVDEALARFEDRHPGRHSGERLRTLVSDFLLPKGLLVEPGKQPAVAERAPDHRRSFLYVKLPLLRSKWIDPLARSLAWAFGWPVLAAWFPLFVALHVLFYGELLPATALDVNQIRAGDILVLLLLTTVGAFVHELGHAAAAASFGCRRIEIGWGLYLVFTVLYTNVSEAWKLPRRQRAVVDLGGIYFQSFFLAALLGLYYLTGGSVYLLAFLFMDLTLASSLNPFLRLDGYWLVSDLLGIVNLREQSLKMVRRRWRRLVGSAEGSSEPPTLSRSARWGLGIYTVLSVVFFVFLTKVLVERVLLRIAIGLPELVADYWLTLTTEGMGGAEIAVAAAEVLWRVMMLLGVAFLLFNVSRRAVAFAGRTWRRRSRERRGPSTAAGAA